MSSILSLHHCILKTFSHCVNSSALFRASTLFLPCAIQVLTTLFGIGGK